MDPDWTQIHAGRVDLSSGAIQPRLNAHPVDRAKQPFDLDTVANCQHDSWHDCR